MLKKSAPMPVAPPPPEARPPTGRPVEIRIPRWAYVFALLLLVASWCVTGYILGRPRMAAFLSHETKHIRRSDPGGDRARIFMADQGPWGEIELTRVDIEPPDAFLGEFATKQADVIWSFTGYTPEQLEATIREIGMDHHDQAVLLDRARWKVEETGIQVRPGDDLIVRLRPGHRERLYAKLAACGGNPRQELPVAFNPRFVDERFENCSMSPEAIRMVRGMIYPRGSVLLFSDTQTALNRLNSEGDRIRLLKTISRKTALVGRLLVDPTTDLNVLMAYWGKGGRAKDLEPLLSSLARVPGGCAIDLVHLMGQFARQRVYTFPFPSTDPLANREDCHWTALNFFQLTPDDSLTQPTRVMEVIDRDYYPLPGAPRFGDLVFLMKPNSEVAHSCVYIAEQIVFTKNGASADQPWLLMSLPYLLDSYTAFQPTNAALQVIYYRKRDQ